MKFITLFHLILLPIYSSVVIFLLFIDLEILNFVIYVLNFDFSLKYFSLEETEKSFIIEKQEGRKCFI